jgi:hypothetical protein
MRIGRSTFRTPVEFRIHPIEKKEHRVIAKIHIATVSLSFQVIGIPPYQLSIIKNRLKESS